MVKCKHTSTYIQKEIIEFVKLENKPQKNTREISIHSRQSICKQKNLENIYEDQLCSDSL